MAVPHRYFILPRVRDVKLGLLSMTFLWVLKISLVIRRNFRGQTATKIWR